MTVGQYEERFRRPAPSLHQIFAATRGRYKKRWRRRIWVAAAAVGAMAITWKVAPHPTLPGWTGGHHRTTAAQEQKVAATSPEYVQTVSLSGPDRRC
jgi:hypothetical protein